MSRSALGWLLNDQFHLAENALVVLALSADNRRKLAGLLRRQGVQAAVDMPPRYDAESDQKTWVEGRLRLTEEISTHIRVRLTSRRLNEAIREKHQMQRAIANFKAAPHKRAATLSQTAACPLRQR